MSVPEPSLVVHHSRRRGALIASAALAVLSLLLLTAGSPTERTVGGLCVAVFGVSALIMARPPNRTPALVLDSRGLTDTASGLAAGFVPWSSVTGVVAQRVRGQRYLTVQVDAPETVLAAAEPSIRAAMRANVTLLGSPVNIPLRPMTVGVADLTLEMARRTPSALPAALRARLPAGAVARPPATPDAVAELIARAAAASVTLPGAYLDLLADQDGFVAGHLRLYGTRSADGLAGVLEANLSRSPDQCRGPDAADAPVDIPVDVAAGGYIAGCLTLAQDATHDYCTRMSDGSFYVLARSDYRSMAQPSTFSDLIVAALTEFSHPFG